MPAKRQRSPSAHREQVAKQRRKLRSLIELPIEIIDEILSYVLPDVNNVEWVEDEGVPNTLLSHPILQINQALRRICLSWIRRRTIWVFFDLADPYKADHVYTYLRVPIIHPKLEHMIKPENARIHLCLSDTNGFSRPEPHSFGAWRPAIIFPFNFEHILYLVEFVYQMSKGAEKWSFVVKCFNVAGRFDRQVQDLLLPAILMSRRLNRLDFELEGKPWYPQVVDKYATLQAWSMADYAIRAQNIGDRIEKLKRNGYHDEAGLLALASHWVLEEAGVILPSAGDWSRGTSGEAESHILSVIGDTGWQWGPTIPRAQNSEGNRFRSSVHKIEYFARLAFAMFVERYGRIWYDKHAFMFGGEVAYRFSYDDCNGFAWFGLTLSESVELYYSRARCKEAFASIDFDISSRSFYSFHLTHPTACGETSLSRNETISLQSAAEDMYFAQLLGHSKEHLDKYNYYKKLLGPGRTAEMEDMVAKTFIIIREKSNTNVSGQVRQVLWAGDKRMLTSWGWNEDMEREDYHIDPETDVYPLRYLALAHQGLNVSQTFADWGREKSTRIT